MVLSYSSIATFKQCPLKFKFAYIDKIEVDDEPSPAMERGSAIHDSVEGYFLGTTEYLHPDIHKDYGQFMHSLREEHLDIKPEYKWGITWTYEPCDYDDPRAMLHGYVDLLILPENEEEGILQYEWKTGKKYDDHTTQAWMYAVAMLTHFPERPFVESYTTYFDINDYTKVEYKQDMMFEYRPMLRRQVAEVHDADKFPPMPGWKCKWCKFSRYKGGPCPVG